MSMGSLWNDIERAKPTTTFSPINLSWTALDSNRSLYDEMPATSLLKVLYSVYMVYVKLVHLVAFIIKKEVIVIYREIIQNTCVSKMQEFFVLNLAVRTNILTARS
jgi:hypothetical protein